MRVAAASSTIQDWLEELSAWPWPTHNTSAGFERPPAKRRKLFENSPSDNGLDAQEGKEANMTAFLGSLPVSDVARYERRIQEIENDMEDLDVEEIKNHILHNHIAPLSRPGTPISDSFRSSTMSASAYAHLDDFSALITATLVQALPNLSKLTRLCNRWSIRLKVLRKSSSFLTALTDAEIALKAGWKAMEPPRHSDGESAVDDAAPGSVLSRSEFDIMKLVVERKVARAGQYLDFMLDAMEGLEDTLPEDWVDRMDAIEQDYAEWAASCDRQIREAEWATLARQTRPAIMVHPAAEDLARVSRLERQTTPVPHAEMADMYGPEEASKPPSDRLPDVSKDEVPQIDGLDDTPPAIDLDTRQSSSDGDVPKTVPIAADSATASKPDSRPDSPGKATGSDMSGAGVKRSPPQVIDHTDSLEEDDNFRDSEFPEPQLPTLPHERRGSEASNATTVIHGLQTDSADFSSDSPDHGTPVHRPLRDAVLPSVESDDAHVGDDTDVPSSPPDFRSSTRSMSVSFNDIQTVIEAPEEDEGETPPGTPPGTPPDASFGLDDDISGDISLGSPGGMSVNSADDHLQQQISEILDSIPAKIRLSSEPSGINLNPPDFRMPTARPKVKSELLSQRSYSSLSNRSSRAGTPSFTLAPAKNPRPRHQRGHQEIKLYHLSRPNGEPPIKLFIRCVGDTGERVMVRVGGGWADLGEYLKEYASHHGRRGGEAKVEVRGLPRASTASPPGRPSSAMDLSSPVSPLSVRKTRRSVGSSAGDDLKIARQALLPKTPLSNAAAAAEEEESSSSNNNNNHNISPPGGSARSRSSSRLSWTEEDSSLGMAGPKAKQVEMSEEKKAWVESVKEKVRLASGDQRAAAGATLALAGKSPASGTATGRAATPDAKLMPDSGNFGELGKVGATKRVFRRHAGSGPGSRPGTGSGNGLGK